MTVDKAILIISVTAIIIVLAYIFRFGALFRPKQTGAGTDSTPEAGRASTLLTRPGARLVIGAGRAVSDADTTVRLKNGM
ncbi:MAG: hypothetical protein JRN21_05785 [Nitrososphaerota archaeon]|nr:hypothetical protein [Nitrososphaerota archaeon]